MRVGFVHGVMNTDNMSILGLTIDYGPYGWLEGYDPQWTPNTTDSAGRRYSFGNQPHIGMWNLTQLANCLMPLFGDAEQLQEILATSYRQHFIDGWQKMMAAKLGLREYAEQYDEALFGELLDLLQATETDYTIFFRSLAKIDPAVITAPVQSVPVPLVEAYYAPREIDDVYLARFSRWLLAYGHRLRLDGSDNQERVKRMHRTNPQYVLRNYLAQQAIEDAENGCYTMLHDLFDLLRNPYDEQPGKEKYFQKRPEWARHKPGSATLS